MAIPTPVVTPGNTNIAAPVLIDRELCMGDSLQFINGNTDYFNLLTNALQLSANNLRTLINTLSTNMNQIMNVPYAKLVEVASTVGTVQSARAINGSTSADDFLGVSLFPGNVTTRNLNIFQTPANYLNTLNITKNNDNSIQFPSTGIYEINAIGPALYLPNMNSAAAVDLILFDQSSNIILQSTPYITAGNSTSGICNIKGRFSVTSTATKYTFTIRQNQGSVYMTLVSPVANANSILFDIDIYKVS